MTERVDIESISARLADATPGPWYKPEGQPWLNQRIVFGPSDSMPDRLEQVCSLDEGAHRPEVDATLIAHAPTDLAACVEEIRELRKVARYAESIMDWIAELPSQVAIIAGSNTEANQVHNTPEQPWHHKDGETQRHWLGHVGPAVRAAFDQEREALNFPGSALWKLRSSLMAYRTKGEHAFEPNTGKCRCGKDWLCDMRALDALGETDA